jgi:predicted O-linked N-acetylglucosamine transferase (SPINDLY family)
MPELITSSLRAYEDLAVELALHPDMLANICVRLVKNRLTTPMFDTASFTKTIETAFSEMVARSTAGLEPSDMVVTSDRPSAMA